MSLLGTIFSKIFPSNHPAAQAGTSAQPAGQGQQAQQAQPGAQQSSGASSPGVQQSRTANMPQVDVEKVLDDMAKNNAQKLNWRTSIVDLMKLVGMDSSQQARKQLAQELHYSGDTNDSAAMNIWLHKQVMAKIAENGGKLPQDLVRH